jgi:hypothetical protein
LAVVQVSREDGWMGGEEVCKGVVEGEVWVVSGRGKEVRVVVIGVQGGGEEKDNDEGG